MMTPQQYALRAANGMIRSMEHYNNSSPAVGDGRVSTPAYYANMLRMAMQMLGHGLADLPVQGEWWGNVWLAYARKLIETLPAEASAA